MILAQHRAIEDRTSKDVCVQRRQNTIIQWSDNEYVSRADAIPIRKPDLVKVWPKLSIEDVAGTEDILQTLDFSWII